LAGRDVKEGPIATEAPSLTQYLSALSMWPLSAPRSPSNALFLIQLPPYCQSVGARYFAAKEIVYGELKASEVDDILNEVA